MMEQEWAKAQDLGFSLDLVEAAKQQLTLLAIVDRTPQLCRDGQCLNRAIHRYTKFWLPLAALHDEHLIPPLDCAWVWHCHRLNPIQYAQDCERLFGKLVDAPLIVDEYLRAEAASRTEILWRNQYADEPFDFSVDGSDPGKRSTDISYDLVDAVCRQKSFYYQVSLPHYLDENFLQAANERYKGFLHLVKTNKNSGFFVPTYDVDLMWHAHQLSPKAYHQDMLNILGYVLNHDDTDSDRSKGKTLDNGFCRTRKLWMNTYGFPYEKAGCMYRGKASAKVENNQLSKGNTMQIHFAIGATQATSNSSLHVLVSAKIVSCGSGCGGCGGGCGGNAGSGCGCGGSAGAGAGCGSACGAGGCGGSSVGAAGCGGACGV